jgi:methyl-accepting chemotaxis protein
MSERSQAEEDLHATSEAIRSDAEKLAELEDIKLGMDKADPRVNHVSEQAEELASEIKQKSEAERELSDKTTGGEGPAPPN